MLSNCCFPLPLLLMLPLSSLAFSLTAGVSFPRAANSLPSSFVLAPRPRSAVKTRSPRLPLSPPFLFRRYPEKSLGLSTDDFNADNADTNDRHGSDIVDGRKKRLVVGYRLTTLAYGILGLVGLRTYETFASWPLIVMAASGTWLASGLAYILTGAAANDRLSSDTYKRLNLVLRKYGALGLVISTLDSSFSNPLWNLAHLLAVINSIKGYGYGLMGWDKNNKDISVLGDLVDGTNGSLKRMLSFPKQATSAGYWAATAFVGTLKLLKLWEIGSLLWGQSPSLSPLIASRLVRYNQLAMLTLVLFTLKDAADRDRLQGTSFIKLNVMSFAVLASMAVYYLSLVGPTNQAMGIAAAAFSLLTGVKGITCWAKKRNSSSS